MKILYDVDIISGFVNWYNSQFISRLATTHTATKDDLESGISKGDIVAIEYNELKIQEVMDYQEQYTQLIELFLQEVGNVD